MKVETQPPNMDTLARGPHIGFVSAYRFVRAHIQMQSPFSLAALEAYRARLKSLNLSPPSVEYGPITQLAGISYLEIGNRPRGCSASGT